MGGWGNLKADIGILVQLMDKGAGVEIADGIDRKWRVGMKLVLVWIIIHNDKYSKFAGRNYQDKTFCGEKKPCKSSIFLIKFINYAIKFG